VYPTSGHVRAFSSILDFKLSLCSECCMLFLGNSLEFVIYMPTFRNTPSVSSSQVGIYMEMEQAGGSETTGYKLQTPGNYPEESIQHL